MEYTRASMKTVVVLQAHVYSFFIGTWPFSSKKGEIMKAFLEEYGIAIFVIACITLLVVMADPISSQIQDAVTDTITTFTTSTIPGTASNSSSTSGNGGN